MAITLVFDKFQGHPLTPDDISQGNESVYTLPGSNGDFIEQLAIVRVTQTVTLQGCPVATADIIEGLVGDYATAVTQGNKPTPNVTLDGKSYAVKNITKGPAVTVNGNKTYPKLQFLCVSNEFTIG